MKDLKKNTDEKKKRFIFKLSHGRFIWFLFLVFVILVGLKLYFTNLLATSGVRLTATTQKIEKLEEEKAKLENQISKLGSIARLQKIAKKTGFVEPEKVEILTAPEPLAQKP